MRRSVAAPGPVRHDLCVVSSRVAGPLIPVRVHGLVPLLIGGLWLLAIRGIRLEEMTDLGLVSVTPISALLLLALLNVSFALSLVGRPTFWVPLAHVVVLIVMLYGVTAFVEHDPRFASVWKHVGVMDYIDRHGSVNPHIDAYFNWPGFFALGALITNVAGFTSPLAIAAWGPIAFNLLAIAPLTLIFRWATDDRRLVWLSLWVFYSTNWVGQDYIAPQAVGFLVWLTIAAALLTWFVPRPDVLSSTSLRRLLRSFDVRRVRTWIAARSVRPMPSASGQRVGLFLLVVGMFAAIVTGHQLTPFAALCAVVGLALFAALNLRGLPLIMGVLLAAWIGYMTTTYLAGHIETVAGPFGSLGKNLDQNVGNRVGGSPDHELIARIRIVTSCAIWLLAIAGFARRLASRRFDAAIVVLGASPFVLPVLQPYGGEVLLRVFLFALPAVAFFIATLAFPSTDAGRSWPAVASVAIVGCLLLSAFEYTRYGNERLDHFSRGDVATVRAMYRLAPPGSTLVAGSYNIPWQYRDYADYEYRFVTELKAWRQDKKSPKLITELRDSFGKNGSYVVITQSTKISTTLLDGRPGQLTRFVKALRRSRAAREIYRGPDGDVFFVRGAPRS
jgi:hypothetical protein